MNDIKWRENTYLMVWMIQNDKNNTHFYGMNDIKWWENTYFMVWMIQNGNKNIYILELNDHIKITIGNQIC